MANIASPVPITDYNPDLDTASITWQIPVGVDPASWLDPRLGTAQNSLVQINKSGLLDSLSALEKPAVINFLAAQYSATATGLLVAGAGVANLAVPGAGATQAAATAISLDFNVVTTITASSADGVKLPAITPLRTITIINNDASGDPLNIYPFLGDYIGTALVNVAVVLAAGQKAVFYAKSTAVANTVTAIWQRLV